MRVLLPAILSLLALQTSAAADLRSVDVDYEDGYYTMNSTVWFDATVEQVFEVFRQWDLSTEFSSAIVEARDVEADEQGRPGYCKPGVAGLSLDCSFGYGSAVGVTASFGFAAAAKAIELISRKQLR